MARAKIYCEITCNNCGGVLKGSGYYENVSIISKLKENAKRLIGYGMKSFVEIYVQNVKKKLRKNGNLVLEYRFHLDNKR